MKNEEGKSLGDTMREYLAMYNHYWLEVQYSLWKNGIINKIMEHDDKRNKEVKSDTRDSSAEDK